MVEPYLQAQQQVVPGHPAAGPQCPPTWAAALAPVPQSPISRQARTDFTITYCYKIHTAMGKVSTSSEQHRCSSGHHELAQGFCLKEQCGLEGEDCTGNVAICLGTMSTPSLRKARRGSVIGAFPIKALEQ
eukprot:scaffold90360_cov18-Tisochrysis_lutea.AAC.1